MLGDMKEDESPSSGNAAIVSDPAVADLLTNPATLELLSPFLGRENTVAEAARETGTNPNSMLARVRRWTRMGVLRVTRLEPRAGSTVRWYRTAADSWFIPFDTTSAETLEAGLEKRDRYWEVRLRRAVVSAREREVGNWGTRVYRDSRGRLQIQMAVSPDRNWTSLAPELPAVLAAWRDGLYLDFDDAKQLQRELFDLLLRYQAKDGAQRYLLRIGLAPLEG